MLTPTAIHLLIALNLIAVVGFFVVTYDMNMQSQTIQRLMSAITSMEQATVKTAQVQPIPMQASVSTGVRILHEADLQNPITLKVGETVSYSGYSWENNHFTLKRIDQEPSITALVEFGSIGEGDPPSHVEQYVQTIDNSVKNLHSGRMVYHILAIHSDSIVVKFEHLLDCAAVDLYRDQGAGVLTISTCGNYTLFDPYSPSGAKLPNFILLQDETDASFLKCDSVVQKQSAQCKKVLSSCDPPQACFP